MTVRLPLSGTPTTLKMMHSMAIATRNMTTVMGSSLPATDAATESPPVANHSPAVPRLSSVPTAKMVVMMTKMSSIIGMKLGER